MGILYEVKEYVDNLVKTKGLSYKDDGEYVCSVTSNVELTEEERRVVEQYMRAIRPMISIVFE